MFRLPKKVFGRAVEIAKMINDFERTFRGELVFLLVTGYPGIGKSCLIAELHKPVTDAGGYFVTGKYDQFKENIPYSAIIAAFQDLVKQILMESPAQIKAWKENLLSALGSNGPVVIEVIPDIEFIIGKQPPVLELSAREKQNRFNLVFENFINVFTRKEHPLALFLDNLQWIDEASLKLIETVFSGSKSKYLYVVGAYRNNEVDDDHPLINTLRTIQDEGSQIETIILRPLNEDKIAPLIADIVSEDSATVKPLATIVYEKTGGNPFFVCQFLESLYVEKLIKFDFDHGSWAWDVEKIEAADITDNVVDLMSARVEKLMPETREMLKIGACIGNKFDQETLSLISQKPIRLTALDLWDAVVEGLIYAEEIPLQTASEMSSDEKQTALKDKEAPYLQFSLEFVHPRLRQAIYDLIPASRKKEIHLSIGRMLLEQLSPETRERAIFELVNHFNRGRDLISDRNELKTLVSLYLQAGLKAKSANAYKTAWQYLQRGVDLLPRDAWQSDYEVTLSLYSEMGEMAYLTGQFQRVDDLFDLISQNARTARDKVNIYDVKILIHTASHQPELALLLGIEVLNMLGVQMPLRGSKRALIQASFATKLKLRKHDVNDLINLPELTDPHILDTVRILMTCTEPSYIGVSDYFPLIVFKLLDLTLKHGNSIGSGYAYVCYGVMLCGTLGDIELGYQFGNLAFKIIEKLDTKGIYCKVNFIFGSMIYHWKYPLKEGLEFFRKAYRSGTETGDHSFTSYAVDYFMFHSFFLGESLAELKKKYDEYHELMKNLKQTISLQSYELWYQLVLNLQDESEDVLHLKGDICDEEIHLTDWIQGNEQTNMAIHAVGKLTLFYLFGEYEKAVAIADQGEQYLPSVLGMIFVPEYYFYYSLAMLARYPQMERTKQKQYLKKIRQNHKKMQRWSAHAPANFDHKYLLIKAELSAILGRFEDTVKLYDEAITAAQQAEFRQVEALANELATRFFLNKGVENIAQLYFKRAHECYLTWGAIAKVKDLEKRYHHLLSPHSIAPISRRATRLSEDISMDQGEKGLDLTSVMKASQAISGEIVLDKLLANLMKIVIENAGAKKGFLILLQNGELVISAQSTVGQDKNDLQKSISVAECQNLSIPIVHYTARTHENVVLRNAAVEGIFTQDPYIKKNQVKSILCLPIIRLGELTGILYLENNQISGAFTPDRVEVLRLLSSQAAISIENAKYYAELQESEMKYRNIFENTTHGVYQTTPDGRILSGNPALANILGYATVEELLGAVVDVGKQLYVYPAERKRFQQLLHEHDQVKDFETKLYQRDGNIIFVSLNARIVRDENQNILYYEGMLEDITQRKYAQVELQIAKEDLEERVKERTADIEAANVALMSEIKEREKAENALRHSEERYRTILDNIEHMYYEVDLSGTYTFFNEALYTMFGYSTEEALGKKYSHFVSAKMAKNIYDAFSEVYRTDKPLNIETDIVRKDGTSVPVEIFVALNKDSHGKPIGFRGIVRNIHLRKLAEEEMKRAKEAAEAASAMKSEFLANMSHEIRTPMNAIMGLTDLSLRTDLNAKQRDYLSKIKVSAGTLLGILNDILDFSKIEVGKLHIEAVEFQLQKVLGSMSDMLSGKAAEKGIELNIFIADDVPLSLIGDPLRLGQILINLTSNSVKFTDQGEIVIKVAVIAKNSDQVRLRFSVKDSGIGIPPEQILKLFDPFTQVDGSTTRRFGGTGLGLTICKRLVEMMKGRIWAESELQKGSNFIFDLEFGYLPDVRKKELVPPDNIQGMKVLVVDDNETSRQILEQILTSFRFEVTTVESGQEALQQLRLAAPKSPFQLILMDWKMPEMDGIETSAQIRQDPSLVKVPMIIMVTAFGREEIMKQAEDAGINAFLIKPVNPSLLFDTIMEVFGKSVKQSPAEKRAPKEQEALKIVRGSRILLVEDNSINRQVASEILESVGIVVEEAINGDAAVAAVESSTYDAVLMDVQMPVMDGNQATRIIRENPKNRELPIIAMTAHAMKGDREKCLEAGMNDYVTKPIDSKQLISVLARWLKADCGARDFTSTELERNDQSPDIFPADTLPGIDLVSALQRLGGNKKLLRKLLHEFSRDYSGMAEKIQEALDRADHQAARVMIHNLKGVSGNISALKLYETLVKLEGALKKNKGDELLLFFNHFHRALKVVLETAESLEHQIDDSRIIPDEEQLEDQKKPIDITPLLSELDKLLKRNNPKAEECLLSMKKHLNNPKINQQLKQLENQVDIFDFKNAQKTLTEIVGLLGLSLKDS
ncbi:response regulator [candidate division CSSED10-310 bacterium]|uniref:histidine kinase n=1 Tax=candidate division CSSED10-310 bacterium TaxID=2855610 RepID=A0ABV6YRT2_UNCC1